MEYYIYSERNKNVVKLLPHEPIVLASKILVTHVMATRRMVRKLDKILNKLPNISKDSGTEIL